MSSACAGGTRGQDNPLLAKFELWHLYHIFDQLHYWLVYYGYINSDIRREILHFRNKLTDKAEPNYRVVGGVQ